MKTMFQQLFILAAMSGMAVVGCKARPESGVKDSVAASSNEYKPYSVVWLSENGNLVHLGECPAVSQPPITRFCEGVKLVKRRVKSRYETALRQAIVARRPGGAPQSSNDPNLIADLKDRIQRLNERLVRPDLGADEKSQWETDLAGLKRQLNTEQAAAPLTNEEQAQFDLIMSRLNSNEDVTYREGDPMYDLLLAGLEGCKAGQISDGPYYTKFVCIPPGTFEMGAQGGAGNQGPVHPVTLTFVDREILTTETTQALYVNLMGKNPSSSNGNKYCPEDYTETRIGGARISYCPNHPVDGSYGNDGLSLDKFFENLNALNDGYSYDLPTEAEWEYAARAGTKGSYGGTEKLDEMGWCGEGSIGKSLGIESNIPHRVALKKPNAWGIYDMHGNVWEVVLDQYKLYQAGPVVDPLYGQGIDCGNALRGGDLSSSVNSCSSSSRTCGLSSKRGARIGFRIAREPK